MLTRSIYMKKGFRKVEFEVSSNPMTYSGTINKSILLLVLLIISSVVSWSLFENIADSALILLITTAISGSLIGFITSMFPKISVFTAPIYTILEGLMLGTVSAYFESIVPRVAISAVLTTIAVCTTVLLIFKFKPGITHKLRKFIIIATFSIALLYILNYILNVIGLSFPYINDIGPIGIAINIFIIIIVAGNLLLDFDIIYTGVNNKAPKYMEWYASFGIMVTLVFMYTKILELFFRLFGRDYFKN
ncbi:Bax inhibitor-1/YccA family protein [Oceanirhabdus seepicola]|uniref:Bax inhibitor-1/YccA family protein n=1 Tax=Oceanirhabdus seepicola TaxID=2828781 RepID=A0A9J6P5W9_9CLOT|nr:Bax inhibitor-1/YccA family protein [Oceanirhabdus seepicola]MCM1992218.1 Bax inhibitor-1/YccA family protein [Oceanirhabdus seepicola]